MSRPILERVLDASVVVKWFAPAEPGAQEASRLREDFEAGELTVLAPPLLFLEIMQIAGGTWAWNDAELTDLAAALDDVPFVFVDPPLVSVATWVASGLTATDAAYLAVAEATGAPLVTDDETILRAAPTLAEPLKMNRVSRPSAP